MVCVPQSEPLPCMNRNEKPLEGVDLRIGRMSLHRHVLDLQVRRRHTKNNKSNTLKSGLVCLRSQFVPSCLLTVLSSWRSKIPDARRQLAFSLVGGFTRTIAGAPPLFSIMFCATSFSGSTTCSPADAGPIQAHGSDPLMVAVQPRQPTQLTC